MVQEDPQQRGKRCRQRRRRTNNNYTSFVVAGFLALAGTSVVDAEFLGEPTLVWTHQIPDSGKLGSSRGFKKDNAVVAVDDDLVVATADDGSLHILNPADLANSIVYDPPSKPGTFTECRSGLVIGTDKDSGKQFVLYAVRDTPVEISVEYDGITAASDGAALSSRIFAVNLDGSLRWSRSVSGYVSGSPVLGIAGNRLYVAVNEPVVDVTTETTYQGTILVMEDNGGTAIVLEQLRFMSRMAPFGPPAISQTADGRDFVVVAESINEWYDADIGHLHAAIQTSSGGDEYEFRTVSTDAFPSTTKPHVAPAVDGIWVAGRASTVSGWTGEDLTTQITSGSFSSLTASFSETLSNVNAWDPVAPISASPVVTSDGSTLFVASTAVNLHSFNAETGVPGWVAGDGSSSILASPRTSDTSGGQVVYTIESRNGNVRQHRVDSGTLQWQFDCSSRDGASAGCQDAVEAEFDVSYDGNMLYYGDVYGRVTALRVGSFVITKAPSISPTTSPTSSPSTSVSPTVEGATSSPTRTPTSAPVPLPPVEPTPPPISFPVFSPAADPDGSPPTPTQDTNNDTPPTPEPTNVAVSPGLGVTNQSSDGSSGGGSGSLIGYIAAAVAGVVGLSIAAFFAYILMGKRRKQKELDDMEIERDLAAARKRRSRERELSRTIGSEEIEVEVFSDEPEQYRVVGITPLAPETPPRGQKTERGSEVNTPNSKETQNSLDSIEEGENEDASVVSKGSAGSNGKKSGVAATAAKAAGFSLLGPSPEESEGDAQESLPDLVNASTSSPDTSTEREVSEHEADLSTQSAKTSTTAADMMDSLAYLPMALQGAVASLAGAGGKTDSRKFSDHPEEWENQPKYPGTPQPGTPMLSPANSRPSSPRTLLNGDVALSPAQSEAHSIDSASLYLEDDLSSVLTRETSKSGNGSIASNKSPPPSPGSFKALALWNRARNRRSAASPSGPDSPMTPGTPGEQDLGPLPLIDVDNFEAEALPLRPNPAPPTPNLHEPSASLKPKGLSGPYYDGPPPPPPPGPPPSKAKKDNSSSWSGLLGGFATPKSRTNKLRPPTLDDDYPDDESEDSIPPPPPTPPAAK